MWGSAACYNNAEYNSEAKLMKKTAIVLYLLSGIPLLSQAAVSVNITTPGVSVQVGERDSRGHFWDGYDWRSSEWWREHQGRHVGMHGSRGYWNGHGWQRDRPSRERPAPRDNRDEHQRDDKHDHNRDQPRKPPQR